MSLKTIVACALLCVSEPTMWAQNQLQNILSPSNLPHLKGSRLIQVSSSDTTGGNNDFIPIRAGTTAVLAEIKGPGVIVNIWVTIASPDKHFLRRILLRMSWDGEDNPSVEVPIGDFFGTGFQYKQYLAPYVGMSSGGYYCYFPMPFNTSARVEVVNQTGQEITSFYYHIDYQKLTQPLEPDVGYFHAQWRREPRTDPSTNYTILEAEGQGHVVGVNLNMQSYNDDMQYLEGDEMVTVDGEKRPSINGTGTEDYFNSGWYFNRGEFAGPYHGLILKDDSLQRIAAYRFHIQDAIPFTRSILFTIEHGDHNAEIADYSSTVYWYQKEPHRKFEPIPPAGLRIPLRVVVPNGAHEAESLKPERTHLRSTVEDMSPYGADWSGHRQLKVLASNAGNSFDLTLPGTGERYDVSVYYTLGPEYGTVDVLHEGKKVGELDGYAKTILPGGRIVLEDLPSRNNGLPIQFRVSGKNSNASGYNVGLDAFTLEPRRVYIPEWYLIGPFPNPRDSTLKRLGLDIPYAPEREIDLTKAYPGVESKPVRWVLERTPSNGRMDLYKFDPYEMVVIYATTFMYSPKDQTLPLLLGSDDGAKVFLNGNEIHRILTIRVARPDQDRIPLTLKKEWNTLLLKIENNYGGYNFYARVLDPENSLTFSSNRERR